jgi:hypothetical protein
VCAVPVISTPPYALCMAQSECDSECDSEGKSESESDEEPLPEGKRWHFFLSHRQQGADGYAALVKEKLHALGYNCWLDTAEPADTEGMEAGVKGSVCVLLFLFKGTLNRPYCRFELRLARAHGVPVIALLEGDAYRDTYISTPNLTSAFDRGELPADLRCIVEKADFNFFYRRQEHENEAMISRLCEKLELAKAAGAWPAFTQAPQAPAAVGRARSNAYELLHRDRDNDRRAKPVDPKPKPPPSSPSILPARSLAWEVPWEDDTKVHECGKCQKKFSLLVRRHHCRRYAWQRSLERADRSFRPPPCSEI